jgi:hypothetical protein
LDYEESFKYCYYEKGKTGIKHLLTLNDSGVLIDKSTYELLMEDLFAVPAGENQIYSDFNAQLSSGALTSGLPSDYVPDPNYPTFGVRITNVSTIPSWKEAQFKSAYIPITDVHVSVGGSGTSLIDNQTDSKLAENRFVSAEKSKLDRLGNVEMTVDRNGLNVYGIGDYYGDYKIDQRDLSLSETNIKQHYHFTKDYNALNEASKLKKEYRAYSIPVEGYVKSVVEVSGQNINDYSTGFSNVDGLLIVADSHYVFLPKIDTGNGMVFRFVDNYSCLDYLTFSDTWLEKIRYVTRSVPYVDADGRMESLYCRLVKRTSSNIGSYPFESLSNFSVTAAFTLWYHKDSLEQLEIMIYKEK